MNSDMPSPLLTGDVLFQQRINKCMEQFTWALGENNVNGLVGMFSATNGLYIDLEHYLDQEESAEIENKLAMMSSSLARAISDEHKKSITQVLDLSRHCMKVLINKAHAEGFIVRKR